MRTSASMWGSLAVLCLTVSCVRVLWARGELHRPLAASAHEPLRVPGSTLAESLERLGAPLYVWEEGPGQVALAWGWHQQEDWGLNLSIPLAQELSATLDYQDTELDMLGLVLVFNSQDRLIDKRLGPLGQIAPELQRRRPSLVEAAPGH